MKLLKTILFIFSVLFVIACGTYTPNPQLVGMPSQIGGASESLNIFATDDTNTKEESRDQIKGDSSKVDVWSYHKDDKNGYMKFDIPSYIDPAKIEKAELNLWVRSAWDPGSISLQAVSGSWDEYSLNYNNEGLLNSQEYTRFYVGEESVGKYLKVDITGLVRSWASGGLSNDGIALLPLDDVMRIEFYSKESIENPSFLSLEVQ